MFKLDDEQSQCCLVFGNVCLLGCSFISHIHEGDDVTLFLAGHFRDHNNELELMKDGGTPPFLTFD